MTRSGSKDQRAMIHAPRHSRYGPQRARPVGLLFALMVMCLAVVPHATFAASMIRASLPGQPHRLQATMATAAEPLQAHPCHETTQAGHPATAAPLCCIVGCGLIAQAPAAPPLPEPVIWSRAVLPSALPVRSLSTEPAERPPRSGVRLT